MAQTDRQTNTRTWRLYDQLGPVGPSWWKGYFSTAKFRLDLLLYQTEYEQLNCLISISLCSAGTHLAILFVKINLGLNIEPPSVVPLFFGTLPVTPQSVAPPSIAPPSLAPPSVARPSLATPLCYAYLSAPSSLAPPYLAPPSIAPPSVAPRCVPGAEDKAGAPGPAGSGWGGGTPS